MKKTTTVNIAGIAFIIDEDAYNKLEWYLNTISSHFENKDERQEIMGDIEQRISELFKEKAYDSKIVITIDDIDKMIEILGSPHEIFSEDAKTDEKEKTESYPKRVYRDLDDRIIGGVCSGISAYFNIDPIILRVAFVIAFFVYGSGFLFYLLLWIVIPGARTTAQRLEMKGEPVTVANIHKSVKDEYNDIKNKYRKDHAKRITRFSDKLADFIRQVVYFMAKTFKIAFGIIFLLCGVSGLIALTTVLFFAPLGGIIPLTILTNNYILSGINYYLFIASVLLVGTVPLLAITYIGFKLTFNIKANHRLLGISALAAWILGILVIIPVVITEVSNYKYKRSINETIPLKEITSDTIQLVINDYKKTDTLNHYYHGDHKIFIEGEKIYMPVKLIIERIPGNQINLLLQKKSRGKSPEDARLNVSELKYIFKVEKNVINLPNYFEVPQKTGFRLQQINIVLQIPDKKVIVMDEETEDLLDEALYLYDMAAIDKKTIGQKY